MAKGFFLPSQKESRNSNIAIGNKSKSQKLKEGLGMQMGWDRSKSSRGRSTYSEWKAAKKEAGFKGNLLGKVICLRTCRKCVLMSSYRSVRDSE